MGCSELRSRLQELQGPEELKHPILLPSDHVFTRLLISATHVRLLHAVVQVTLLDLRSRFWILKGRRTIRKVLQSCLACRRLRLHRASVPVAPLPKDRIREASPFYVLGVYFCGPLYYRSTVCEALYCRLLCGDTGGAPRINLRHDSTLIHPCLLSVYIQAWHSIYSLLG